MTKIIEIVISPDGPDPPGNPRLCRPNLPRCQPLSGAGAGQAVSEQLTAEFHQSQPSGQVVRGEQHS